MSGLFDAWVTAVSTLHSRFKEKQTKNRAIREYYRDLPHTLTELIGTAPKRYSADMEAELARLNTALGETPEQNKVSLLTLGGIALMGYLLL